MFKTQAQTKHNNYVKALLMWMILKDIVESIFTLEKSLYIS